MRFAALEIIRTASADTLEVEIGFELARACRSAGRQDQSAEYYSTAVQMTKRMINKLDERTKSRLCQYLDEEASIT